MLVTLGSLGVKRLKLQFLSLNGILIHRKLPQLLLPQRKFVTLQQQFTVIKFLIPKKIFHKELLFSDFYPIFFIKDDFTVMFLP